MSGKLVRSFSWVAATALAIGCSHSASHGGGRASGGSGAVDHAAGSGGSVFENPSPVADASQADANAGAFDDSGTIDCGRQDFDVQRKPADVLLVLDRSGSMKDAIEDDPNKTSKWDVVVPALQQVIKSTDQAVSWGLKLFPEGDNAGECNSASYPKNIAVELKSHNAAAVNAAIQSAMPKGDGTPTGDAVDEAVKYLKTLSDQNRKYILLATDGEPSCDGTNKDSSDARTAALQAVTNAAGDQFNTFVIGIATTKSSASKTLTDLASAGMEAPSSGYYLASTQDQLIDAVRAIAGSVATCVFPLSMAPPNPDHVGVLIGSRSIARDPAKKNGWSYVDDSMTAVQLYGPACDSVTSSGSDMVRVVFGCKEDPLF